MNNLTVPFLQILAINRSIGVKLLVIQIYSDCVNVV